MIDRLALMPSTVLRSRVTFLSEAEGGRSFPATDGYRAAILFGSHEVTDVRRRYRVFLVFEDDESVGAGQTTTARVFVIPSKRPLPTGLAPGVTFDVAEPLQPEGKRWQIVARATVLDVLEADGPMTADETKRKPLRRLSG